MIHSCNEEAARVGEDIKNTWSNPTTVVATVALLQSYGGFLAQI
jgi:hypothetical protein